MKVVSSRDFNQDVSHAKRAARISKTAVLVEEDDG